MSKYVVMEQVGERTRIEVTHLCGHVQVCSPKTEYLVKGEERFPEYTKRQYTWLSQNLCPGCFTLAKIKNPDYKPIGDEMKISDMELSQEQRARAIAYNPGNFSYSWWAWAANLLTGTPNADILTINIKTWREAQSF